MMIRQIDEFRWELPIGSVPGMRVPGLIFADAEMMKTIKKDESLKQVAQTATLPGAVKASIAMPDIHFGYGFPIGGVLASRTDSGVVSPGGVGFDINCGVRLLATGVHYNEVQHWIPNLVSRLFKHIPTGVGSSGAIDLKERELKKILVNGMRWAVDSGYGTATDLEYIEDFGCLHGCDPGDVSAHARERGMKQLGTLGSGNHFIEIQVVDTVFSQGAATAFGLELNQITIMIHTGSRGLGHQVCTDHLKVMGECLRKYGISVPDRQLACTPFQSSEGKAYLSAMRGAANFAWVNRQCITHRIREVWGEFIGQKNASNSLRVVYDLAHNIVKVENHDIEGRIIPLAVHRKGATRSLAAGAMEIPLNYRAWGQPVIIPGDMGRASYVVCGTKQAQTEAFSSSCHGAGRLLSRKAAIRAAQGRSIIAELNDRGISVAAAGKATLAEEMSEAYKPIDQVIAVMSGSGLACPIVRLRPLGVIKG